MKTRISVVVLFIIIIVVMVVIINRCSRDIGNIISKHDNEMKSHVGDTVIIQKDTLIIVNYSIWSEDYTLNNGVKIDKEYIKN